MGNRLIGRCAVAFISGIVLALPAISSAGTTVGGMRGARAETASAGTSLTGPRVRCVARSHTHDALAIRMAHDIDRRLVGRASTVGLMETDSRTGITCQFHAAWHFYAASVIKATILAALLRKAQEEHRHLSASEKNLAWLMITRSDNNAATALWNDVGMRRMQHFLNLAKMRQTRLARAWGLSLITANDEILLLSLLSTPSRILSKASRVYARYLMAHVIGWQRWGVPAGAPRSVRVHVKNGWLPYGSGGWEINSIGFFTSPDRVYAMAILTYDNPSMAYGIYTIEGAAEAIHRALNPGKRSVIPRSTPNPSWGIPDETIPDAS